MEQLKKEEQKDDSHPGVLPPSKALVPVSRYAPRGWFYRFLVRVGIKSTGSLRDDLDAALAGEGRGGDVFSANERAMLRNILRLKEQRVEDVMVPRAEIDAVDHNISIGELLQTFQSTNHSRLPVYEDTLDDPRGMVLVKDLLLHLVEASGGKNKKKNDKHKQKENDDTKKVLDLSGVDLNKPLRKLKIIRRVLFVPPSMLASDLMARMQTERTQMALVIDEHGGTDGIVSLEDIVEEVVGEIEDELDEDSNMIIRMGDNIWTADARVEIKKIQDEIGTTFDPGETGEDMETIGGLVFELAGRIPARGEVVRGLGGFEFRILDADPRRIRRLQIVRSPIRQTRKKQKSQN